MADEKKPAAGTVKSVKEALDELSTRVNMYGGSVCDLRVIAALSDEEVQKRFATHVEKCELFTGAYCPSWPSIPEEAPVLFEFRVIPPKVFLCPVYFLVILDVFTAKVVRIFDPYTEVAARPLHGALTAGY